MGPLQQVAANPLNDIPQFELTPAFYSREWETISFSFVAQGPWTCFTWEHLVLTTGETSSSTSDAPTMAYCLSMRLRLRWTMKASQWMRKK